MKIAGKKNDGAWFRANKAIHEMGLEEDGEAKLANLSSYLYTTLGGAADSAFAAITALANDTGVEPPASPGNASAWVSRMITDGIPRQVWFGRLSFTTYTRAGGPGAYTYTADHQTVFHQFARGLRKHVARWLHGRRAINDLTDTGLAGDGNPGGQPDSVPNN